MKDNLKIFLVGMPGSGKSTFGKELSGFLSVDFVDMDKEIEKRAGMSIGRIFETKGECFFREAEKKLLNELNRRNSDIIVSTGGGIICDGENRNILLSENTVYLDVDLGNIIDRITLEDDHRPLITDVRKDVENLYQKRKDLYGEFVSYKFREFYDSTYFENGISDIPGFIYTISRKIGDLSGFFTEKHVDFDHDIKVKACALSDIEKNLCENEDSVFFITSETVNRIYGGMLPRKCAVYPDGEKAKDILNLERIWKELLGNNYNRNHTLVSVGGGTITDLGGFAASTYKRGMRYKSVPTTLLAQVDAAIGGKNGINFENVKNMIGSFYQPEIVLADPLAVLSTSREDILNGLVEGLKVCLIVHDDEAMLSERLETAKRIFEKPTLKDIENFTVNSIEDKVTIVKSDFQEIGNRKFLNLGHTFGHAFEMKFGLSHGIAVALGMLRVLSGNENKIIGEYLAFLKQIVSGFTQVDESVTDEEIVELMLKDKKNDSSAVTFVNLHSPGKPFLERLNADQIEKYGGKYGR